MEHTGQQKKQEEMGRNWKINEGEEFPKNYNDFLKEAVKYSMAGMPEGA